jgi:hypothetical protein
MKSWHGHPPLTRVVNLISLVLLMVALGVSVLWYIQTYEYEPFVTSVGLLAAVFGFVINPWAERRSTRSDLLQSLILECGYNIMLMQHERFAPERDLTATFEVYPRLVYPCHDRILSSGLFNDDYDIPFRTALIQDRAATESFNSFLSIFEIHVILQNSEKSNEIQRGLRESDLFKSQYNHTKAVIRCILKLYHKKAELPFEITPTMLQFMHEAKE